MTDPGRATDRFDGRRALVTGGASGIGRAAAELLLERGAAVALLDRDGAVEEAGREMRATAAVSVDVRDSGAVGAAVRQAAARLGGAPDVLVNAAGIYRVCAAAGLDEAAWNEVIDTNLRGTFVVAQEFLRQLRASPPPPTTERACVVNMASTAALVADPGEPSAHYNASKAGVVALTKQLAVEWAADGVRVNAVAPGVIDTPMLRMMDDPEAGRAYLDARVPLRRLGRADEVAEVVVFLASRRASYITGATVVVDGGVTAA
ncbi:MAG TPA: SDR family NAD(P)-dependent oxidoreductase [Actinomycetota bacterium]|nr:SDR family NAD(P)-dependent oxidoreductase [Actinomycetota bacterium]